MLPRRFLRSRSQEMIHGGQMVLTMIGSDKNAYSTENHSCSVWELLGITLYDMVQVGLIEEKKTGLVQTAVLCCRSRRIDWDANMDKGNKSLKSEKHGRGNHVAMSIRVVVQSVLVSHFGDEIMDNMFDKYAIKVEECLKVEKGEYTNMVITMKRK
ncbi:hypothetical protein TIFTF001_046211 [Ficus carica]|uniref:Uncharacterized protein n=1 Tax=Ficus carica TaxID=3494 RepID=A0AA87ZJP3_FICCA|nr:hypothetical protein TIFTF001_046211 [Ficus carica]